MLLNNAWFGPGLRQWEATKTMSRKTKYKASFLIIITISISAAFVERMIQLLLLGIAITLLFFIWRIKEEPEQE